MELNGVVEYAVKILKEHSLRFPRTDLVPGVSGTYNRSSVRRNTDHFEREMQNELRSLGRRYWQVRGE